MEQRTSTVKKLKKIKHVKRIKRTLSISISTVFIICPLIAGTALANDRVPDIKKESACMYSDRADLLVRHELENLYRVGLSEESEAPETDTPAITEEPLTDAETQEPVTDPGTQEPLTDPETQEPVTQEPETDPETQEPVTEEPVTQEPTTKEPVTQEPTSRIPEKTTEEKSLEESTEEESIKETTEKVTKEETSSEKTKEEDTTEEKTTEEETTEETTEENLDVYENVGLVMNQKPEKYGSLYWPLPSVYGTNCISSGYGYRTGTYSGMHAGLDIACPTGTPIYACEDGTVIASYYSDSAGNFTIIQHEGGIYTEYMHQSVRHVKAGEHVKAGQLIGLVGSTGWSTGSHLHIGVVISDYGYDITKRVDPTPYLTLLNKLDVSVNLLKQTDMIIDYSAGKRLKSAVTQKAELTKELKPLFSAERIKKVASSGFKGKGYYGKTDDNQKKKKKNAAALIIEPGFDRYNNTWVRYETEDYDLLLTIKASYNSTEQSCPVVVKLDAPTLCVNRTVYKDKNLKEGLYLTIKNEEGIYVSLAVHAEVYKHGTKKRIEIPELYQVIGGIDGAQSYRCLNEKFNANALFVKNRKKFARNLNKNDKTNCITESGDIYSEYSEKPLEEVKSGKDTVLYRKTQKTQTEGLDMVMGFRHKEHTSFSFYVPEYTITFNSSKGGKVSKKTEELLYGTSLKKGVKPKAKKGYEFVKWVSDQNLIVGDKIIKAGEKIIMKQIKSLAVTKDMSFTAKFAKKKEVKQTH